MIAFSYLLVSSEASGGRPTALLVALILDLIPRLPAEVINILN